MRECADSLFDQSLNSVNDINKLTEKYEKNLQIAY